MVLIGGLIGVSRGGVVLVMLLALQCNGVVRAYPYLKALGLLGCVLHRTVGGSAHGLGRLLDRETSAGGQLTVDSQFMTSDRDLWHWSV